MFLIAALPRRLPSMFLLRPLIALTVPATNVGALQRRWATKKVGGSTSNGRDSPGQRLGVKHFGGELVKIGHIVMRQRGTQFYPGVNMGARAVSCNPDAPLLYLHQMQTF